MFNILAFRVLFESCFPRWQVSYHNWIILFHQCAKLPSSFSGKLTPHPSLLLRVSSMSLFPNFTTGHTSFLPFPTLMTKVSHRPSHLMPYCNKILIPSIIPGLRP